MKVENSLSGDSRQDAVEVKLIRLRKACLATEKLLYGDLAAALSRAAAMPDLKALKLPLLRLSAVYEMNCQELAQILVCKSKFFPPSKPVDLAIRWLLSKSLPSELQNPAGRILIQEANESQNIEFFKMLGRTIKDWKKRVRASETQTDLGGLNELRFILMICWKPSGKWPGLAYCTHTARIEYLKILERGKVIAFPFNKKISPNNLDLIRSRLGMIPARKPFISSIKQIGSSLRFS